MFYCKCGFEVEDKKAMRTHILRESLKHKGVHGWLKVPVTPATVETTEAQALPASEVKVEIAQAQDIKQENPKQTKLRPEGSQLNWTRWALVACSVGLVAVGGFVGMMWMDDPRNMGIGLFTIACLAGGLFLGYSQIKSVGGNKGSVVVLAGLKAQRPKGQVNSLNIYGYRDEFGKVWPEKVTFEQVEKPLGQPQQCLNDNDWYHIHLFDLDKKELVPFNLPDARYTDPAFMARYLGIPAQKRYLSRHRESLARFIGPGVLAVLNIMGFIAIIALAG